MSNCIKVLVIDDHKLVRDTIAESLRALSDMDVVGCAADAGDGLAQAIERRPDIVLMDIDMPGVECFDAARTLSLRVPDVRLIFVSGFVHDRYIEAALNLVNTAGYVTKGESPEVLIEAIRAAARGEVFFSSEVQDRIIVDEGGPRLVHPGQTRASTLTERELAVLRSIARGLSQKEIANVLSLSPKTVNFHISNLMNKLDIHDRVGLTRYAIAEKLVEP